MNFHRATVVSLCSVMASLLLNPITDSIPTIFDLSVAFDTIKHCPPSSLFHLVLFLLKHHWWELVTWLPPTSRKSKKVRNSGYSESTSCFCHMFWRVLWVKSISLTSMTLGVCSLYLLHTPMTFSKGKYSLKEHSIKNGPKGDIEGGKKKW